MVSFIRISYALSMISATIGLLVATFGVVAANGAPQEAAAAAIALCWAIIPYCFTRALHEIRRIGAEG